MKKYSVVIVSVLLMFVLSGMSNAKAEQNSQLNEISGAYQNLMLNYYILKGIDNLYPDLSGKVQKARQSLKNTFGKAENKMKDIIKSAYKEKFKTYYVNYEKEVLNTITKEELNHKDAIDYINDVVTNCANRRIDFSGVEVALAYQYWDNPSEEMQKGFINEYKSIGNRRTKGIDLILDLPRSWFLNDQDAKGNILLLKSNYARWPAGGVITSVEFFDHLSGDQKAKKMKHLGTDKGAKDFADDLFADGKLKAATYGHGLQNVRIIDVKRFKRNYRHSALVTCIGDKISGGKKRPHYQRLYHVLCDNHLIIFVCEAELPSDKEAQTKVILQWRPLFEAMEKSLLVRYRPEETTDEQINDIKRMKMTSKAYGFVIECEMYLARIKKEYPGLANSVLIANKAINDSYGKAIVNIEKEMEHLYKEESFRQAIEEKLSSTVNAKLFTSETAADLINRIMEYANGQIDTDVLGMLLAYQFMDSPADELEVWNNNIFSTKGLKNANGLDVQVEYPQSWFADENKNGNLAGRFNDQYSYGSVFAILDINDLREDKKNNKLDDENNDIKSFEECKKLAAEYFSSSSYKNVVNTLGLVNFTVLKEKKMEIDGWPAAMIEVIGDDKGKESQKKIFIRQYTIKNTHHKIELQFFIDMKPGESVADLKVRAGKYIPIFEHMAKTMKIHDAT